MASTFLSLPTELRIPIYRDVLAGVRVHLGDDWNDPQYGRTDVAQNETNVLRARAESPLSTALLRVCRQIAGEATEILYDDNCFFYHLPLSLPTTVTCIRHWAVLSSHMLANISCLDVEASEWIISNMDTMQEFCHRAAEMIQQCRSLRYLSLNFHTRHHDGLLHFFWRKANFDLAQTISTLIPHDHLREVRVTWSVDCTEWLKHIQSHAIPALLANSDYQCTEETRLTDWYQYRVACAVHWWRWILRPKSCSTFEQQGAPTKLTRDSFCHPDCGH